MWVNPDAGKTWEQLVEQAWRDLTPEERAYCEAIMAATGQTREKLFRQLQENFQKRFKKAQEDPESPFAKYLVYRYFPFGQDPRLKRWHP